VTFVALEIPITSMLATVPWYLEPQPLPAPGTPGLSAYLFVGAVLFVCGIVCMTTKRNGIGILMGVELILNAGTVNLVAFSRFSPLGLDGQVFALFVIVLAAAEAAIALAIALNFYNNHLTIDVDRANELRG
jgi:NADH:ubiquinone oxidoreductase subunit K